MTRSTRLATGLFLILALACRSAVADYKVADEAGKRGDYAAAIAEGKRMIANGDPDGETIIGWMQINGGGMPKDETEGVRHLIKAAEAGSVQGEFILGYLYCTGWAVEEDLARGIELLRRAAKKGHTHAMANLGIFLLSQEEHPEALQWLKKGAEAGNGLAQANLGYAYFDGIGVEQDVALAITWLRRAATQGNGLKNLGVVYKNGSGVKRNRVAAYALFSVEYEQEKSLVKKGSSAQKEIEKITKNMTAEEIAAGKKLTEQMLNPGQLLAALDRYIEHPLVKERNEAEEEAEKIAAFRKALKSEDSTNCGPVIDRRGNLFKVYFPVSNYGNEHWIRRDNLYPAGFACRFVNGQYVPPQ